MATATKKRTRKNSTNKPAPKRLGTAWECTDPDDLDRGVVGYYVSEQGDIDKPVGYIDHIDRSADAVRDAIDFACRLAADIEGFKFPREASTRAVADLQAVRLGFNAFDMRNQGRLDSPRDTWEDIYCLTCKPLGEPGNHNVSPNPFCPVRFRKMLRQLASSTWGESKLRECPHVGVSICTNPADEDDGKGDLRTITICTYDGSDDSALPF